MPNQITTLQNEQASIDLLAASSRVYRRGKLVACVRRSVPITTAIAGLAALFNREWRGITAPLAVVVLIFDNMVLEQLSRSAQGLGAKLQEVFDCKLFELEWNGCKAGRRPEPETISEYADAYKSKHGAEELKNWYPEAAGSVSLEFGRFICQRASMLWDSRLRRIYAYCCLTAFWLLCVGAYCAGVVWDLGIRDFSVSALPFVPAALLLYREYATQSQSAAISSDGIGYLNSVWSDAVQGKLSKSKMNEAARYLQDHLFERRRVSNPVPEFIYRWFRGGYENQMKVAAQELADQVPK